jgi:hypothetical protein
LLNSDGIMDKNEEKRDNVRHVAFGYYRSVGTLQKGGVYIRELNSPSLRNCPGQAGREEHIYLHT